MTKSEADPDVQVAYTASEAPLAKSSSVPMKQGSDQKTGTLLSKTEAPILNIRGLISTNGQFLPPDGTCQRKR